MSETKTKLQQLLRELYRFDLADLDCGIYRKMNYTRRAIERWTVDLPESLSDLIGLDIETRRVFTQRHKDTDKNLGVSVSPCEVRYLLGLDVETRQVSTQRRKDTEKNLGVSAIGAGGNQ
jgi:hypothetical protein